MIEWLGLRGKISPDSTIEALAAVSALPSGGKLEIISDFPPARHAIPNVIFGLDCHHELHDNGDGTFTITVERLVLSNVS